MHPSRHPHAKTGWSYWDGTLAEAPPSTLGFGLQIIQVNLTSENPRPISPDTSLQFTYSVKWEATDIPFSKRFDRYLDYNFFEHQVRIDPTRARSSRAMCLF